MFALGKTDVPILRSVIHQKQALADTFGQGATVWELTDKPATESADKFNRFIIIRSIVIYAVQLSADEFS